MTFRELPSLEYLRTRWEVDLKSGIITWLPKNEIDYYSRRWNCQWANKVAGAVNSHGYVRVRLDGVEYQAHNIVWWFATGSYPISMLDHKDKVKTNNSFDNLRIATYSQNGANRSLGSNSTSGYLGVHKRIGRKFWRASIKKDGITYRLGNFNTAEDAARARDIKAVELFGEYASLNFPHE